MITIFQDWDVSSNANEGSLACDELESNDESSEDEEESESDTESYQTSEPICESSPVTQMDVAVALYDGSPNILECLKQLWAIYCLCYKAWCP